MTWTQISEVQLELTTGECGVEIEKPGLRVGSNRVLEVTGSNEYSLTSTSGGSPSLRASDSEQPPGCRTINTRQQALVLNFKV
jgi:hypothetical protein